MVDGVTIRHGGLAVPTQASKPKLTSFSVTTLVEVDTSAEATVVMVPSMVVVTFVVPVAMGTSWVWGRNGPGQRPAVDGGHALAHERQICAQPEILAQQLPVRIGRGAALQVGQSGNCTGAGMKPVVKARSLLEEDVGDGDAGVVVAGGPAAPLAVPRSEASSPARGRQTRRRRAQRRRRQGRRGQPLLRAASRDTKGLVEKTLVPLLELLIWRPADGTGISKSHPHVSSRRRHTRVHRITRNLTWDRSALQGKTQGNLCRTSVCFTGS